jgi:MoxR-like ATPase
MMSAKPNSPDDEMISNLSLEQLDIERPVLIDRLQQHISMLSQHFVDRKEVIELAVLCAMLGEPLLLLGPPGTGKSLLCSRLSESFHLTPQERFEYLLTPFTEPSELFGPIDLSALKEGRFIRRHQGSLPHAKVAFLDEIFRANSAILNALLSLLNDRIYYEEGQPKPASLDFFFAATNQLPTDQSLLALSDRFVLKVPVENTHGHQWHNLLTRGLDIEGQKVTGATPWRNGPASHMDLLKLRRFLRLSFAREAEDLSLRDYFFPPPLMLEFQRLVTALELDMGLYISDRKLIKMYQFIRGMSLIRGRSIVQIQDLDLLRFITQRPGEQDLIYEYVSRILGELS